MYVTNHLISAVTTTVTASWILLSVAPIKCNHIITYLITLVHFNSLCIKRIKRTILCKHGIKIERLSCDLIKVFAICFMDQCLARLKQSFSLFPPRKLLIRVMNSSVAQSHYCISNEVKTECRSLSWKFHGELTLFASAFAKPMKIGAPLFSFDKPIERFAFLFHSVFKFIFQGHMNVALTVCWQHGTYHNHVDQNLEMSLPLSLKRINNIHVVEATNDLISTINVRTTMTASRMFLVVAPIKRNHIRTNSTFKII